MPSTLRPRASAGAHGSRKTRGCLLKQAMGHGSQQRQLTVVVEKSELGEGRASAIFDARPGRHQGRCGDDVPQEAGCWR
eukprot:192973-Chlamydomonas_euryale.AAC.1